MRLAVPAFLALVAEPLFLLADTAIVGHLGTAPLAGLGIASAALLTAVNIFVFLAYGTTSVVARKLGAGDDRAAVGAGMDGLWLALVLGVATGLGMLLAARPIVEVFGASEEAIDQAVTYLQISAIGIPAMLVVLAATGVLRGLQDTRTPLVAAVAGFGSNVVLNLVLVYGVGRGIAGAALGTVIAQLGMALGLVWVVVRAARTLGAVMQFHPVRVLRAALDGVPLLIRTLALRAVLLMTTWVAAGLGDVPLASHQVAVTIWTSLTFALDALAIAGQALTGKALGAGDIRSAREATATMVRWGLVSGAVLGGALLAGHQVIPAGFSSDPAVQQALAMALIVVALSQPISGVAFVLDGVLIGAGDGRWLAFAQVAMLVAYLPMLFGVYAVAPGWVERSDPVLTDSAEADALMLLWVAFTGFMVVRTVLLVWRSRTDAWLVTGAGR